MVGCLSPDAQWQGRSTGAAGPSDHRDATDVLRRASGSAGIPTLQALGEGVGYEADRGGGRFLRIGGTFTARRAPLRADRDEIWQESLPGHAIPGADDPAIGPLASTRKPGGTLLVLGSPSSTGRLQTGFLLYIQQS